VRISIIQQAGEGREVHAIRNEVQGLHSGNRPPLIGQESRIDPRRDRRNACGVAINSDFRFTKIGIATAEQIVNGTELIRQAGEPLLISGLLEARQSSLTIWPEARNPLSHRQQVSVEGRRLNNRKTIIHVRLPKAQRLWTVLRDLSVRACSNATNFDTAFCECCYSFIGCAGIGDQHVNIRNGAHQSRRHSPQFTRVCHNN
jgi:hypothetical protein